MADSKISALNPANNVNVEEDVLVIVNEHETRKITVEELFQAGAAHKADLEGGKVPEIELPDLIGCIECTYSQLKTYISESSLKPNRYYHVTDKDY